VKTGLTRPRIIFVTRKTPLELLIERHGTIGQAEFYLRSRGETLDRHQRDHERFEKALAKAQSAPPSDQRRVRVDRDELDRFLFAPDDIIVIVGQDGLVPNVAKYLQGQPTIGINPDPENYDGILCAHQHENLASILAWLEGRHEAPVMMQKRAMAEAVREDGQRLLALNEIFIGHRSHQSARYRMIAEGREVRQYSSGIICATGTGCTGWAKSIMRQRNRESKVPGPEERLLLWFVREPFPSVISDASVESGELRAGDSLQIMSEMGDNGVIFADGIESDLIEFVAGQRVKVGLSETSLNLVMPAQPPKVAPALKSSRKNVKKASRATARE